jgi:hypothetical protein
MRTQLPWLGYRYEMKYQLTALQEAGFDIESTGDMNSGLTLIQKRVYPVVIVQDWSPTGGLTLPPGIDTNDPTELTKYFLTQIRGLPDYTQTPIIVPHLLHSNDAKRLQIDDLVDLVDVPHARSVSGCITDAVRKYI